MVDPNTHKGKIGNAFGLLGCKEFGGSFQPARSKGCGDSFGNWLLSPSQWKPPLGEKKRRQLAFSAVDLWP